MTTAVGFNTPLPMNYPLSRHANSAGAPLPRIPKRTPSGSRTHHTSLSVPTLQMSSPSEQRGSPPLVTKSASPPAATLVVEPPTPPLLAPIPIPQRAASVEASAASSSSSSDSPVQFVVPRARRVRSARAAVSTMRPPEESTPTPSVFHAKTSEPQIAFPLRPAPLDDYFNLETPRASTSKVGSTLRPTAAATTVSVPERPTPMRPEPSTRAASVSVPASVSAQLARKKSGEPLKSSLKSRRTMTRGDLSVVTSNGLASKSEPSTPTHIKSVHFDAQLEHVKLFLAEQKPLAVSRDGSPTTDTSGTESDFPSFIFGSEDRTRKSLAMQVVNMPKVIKKDADVVMEDLVLSSDGSSLNGRVRVRNIAFEKWIAVRFTFDWWQTTSEVTARYVQTVDEGKFDVFGFTIRLNDMLSRIEEKTMFMAIRYTVDGQEIWDNNAGENYQVKFSTSKPRLQNSVESSPEPGLDDLKSKLEKVAIGQETVGGYMSYQSRKSPSPLIEQFDLRSNTPLSSRYDFSASLKRPWKNGSPSSPSHSRNNTYPTAIPQFSPRHFTSPARTKLSEDPAFMTRGSPRILDADDVSHSPALFYAGDDCETTPSGTPAVFSRQRGRNHQRGYFDLSFTPSGGVRKTLPAAFREDAIPRYNSVDTYRVPPTTDAPLPGDHATLLPHMWPIERGGSEESTPSVTSTSESSNSSSPSGSPINDAVFSFPPTNPERTQSPVDDSSYNVFLNKFCFYTGSDSMLDVHPDSIQRSHSASSVEEFLFSPPTYHISPRQTPTRSSSFDDVVGMSSGLSGSTTPTARSLVESESSTPIPLAY